MVYLALGMLVVAAILLVAEIFIPGFGVCGISGLTLLVGSVVVMAIYTPYGGWFALVAIAVAGGSIYAAIRFAKKRRVKGDLILDAELADSGLDDAPDLAGREGVAVTPLKPFGMADFGGIRAEVTSDGALIPANVPVRVTEVRDGKVFVRRTGVN